MCWFFMRGLGYDNAKICVFGLLEDARSYVDLKIFEFYAQILNLMMNDKEIDCQQS